MRPYPHGTRGALAGGMALAWAIVMGLPGFARAQEDAPVHGPVGFGAVEGGGALLTAAMEGAAESLAGHYGLRAGIRVRRWGIALRLEQTFWQTPEGARTVTQSAVNLAIGVEYHFLHDRLRTGLDVGLSILARDNAIDGAGKTGIFIDVRPVGARWRLGDLATVGVEPLHMALVAPVLTGIPLLDVQFRTTVYVELGRRP